MKNLKSLDEFVLEDMNMIMNVNPNMNVQGMADVTMTSGDLGAVEKDTDVDKNKKKRKKLRYIKDMPNYFVNEIK